MNIFKKFLSRKWLSLIGTIIVEILIATGNIPPEVKPLLMETIAIISGVYISAEGIADIVSRVVKEAKIK